MPEVAQLRPQMTQVDPPRDGAYPLLMALAVLLACAFAGSS